MTWTEAQVMLQLEAEERVGFVLRFGAALAKAREDAVIEKLRSVS